MSKVYKINEIDVVMVPELRSLSCVGCEFDQDDTCMVRGSEYSDLNCGATKCIYKKFSAEFVPQENSEKQSYTNWITWYNLSTKKLSFDEFVKKILTDEEFKTLFALKEKFGE